MPDPEAAHEDEDDAAKLTFAHEGFSDRVSMSPAHDTLHGAWPLATSYQFVDSNDEASFVAKDFADMRPMHLLISLTEMLVPPYSLTPLGVQSRPLTWPVTVCIVIQLVVRYADVDSKLGAAWYAKFYFATTIIELIFIVIAQVFFGFAPIASDGTFLVLFFIFVFLQGMLAFSAIVYDTKFALITFVACNVICTLHLWLFVRSSEPPSEAAHAVPEPLVSPIAFGLLYLSQSALILAVIFLLLRARRLHHAELEYLHERLRREKERMAYELAIAQKAQNAVANGAGSSKKAPRSMKSIGSSGGMSSHMSELAGQMTLLKAEDEAREQATRQGHTFRGIRESPTDNDKAEERQQRLWTTLAELGIRPKTSESDSDRHHLL